MKKAYPIDAKGFQNGPERTFSDLQWEKMVNHNGDKLRWRLREETIQPITTKKAESRKKNEK